MRRKNIGKIMMNIFQNLTKIINLPIQEAQQTQNKIKSDIHTLLHIKLSKDKDNQVS